MESKLAKIARLIVSIAAIVVIAAGITALFLPFWTYADDSVFIFNAIPRMIDAISRASDGNADMKVKMIAYMFGVVAFVVFAIIILIAGIKLLIEAIKNLKAQGELNTKAYAGFIAVLALYSFVLGSFNPAYYYTAIGPKLMASMAITGITTLAAHRVLHAIDNKLKGKDLAGIIILAVIPIILITAVTNFSGNILIYSDSDAYRYSVYGMFFRRIKDLIVNNSNSSAGTFIFALIKCLTSAIIITVTCALTAAMATKPYKQQENIRNGKPLLVVSIIATVLSSIAAIIYLNHAGTADFIGIVLSFGFCIAASIVGMILVGKEEKKEEKEVAKAEKVEEAEPVEEAPAEEQQAEEAAPSEDNVTGEESVDIGEAGDAGVGDVE